MRIIGGRDYYDHGLAFGQDESVVFNRAAVRHARQQDFFVQAYGSTPELVPAKRGGAELVTSGWNENKVWRHGQTKLRVEGVNVIFCGRYYCGVRVLWHTNAEDPSNQVWRKNETVLEHAPNRGWQHETFWSMNPLAKFLAKHGLLLKANLPQGDRQRRSLLRRASTEHAERYRVFASFDLTTEERGLLIDNRVTVATLTTDEQQKFVDPRYPASAPAYECLWVVNGDTLKSVDFIKVMDPVMAFQELSMWVGGVLPGEGNPMVQITDDKVKLAKHGMDHWSFRKMGVHSK